VTTYADTPDKIAAMVAAARISADSGEPIGLDTEFYNVNIGKESCVARSKLHLLSIAVKRYPLELHPRGYHLADAYVLTRDALENEGLLELLRAPIRKAVHNLPVDAHTLENEGVVLGGGLNTLAMSRWAWPDRARGAGFTLDALGRDLCGVGKTESFAEVFTETTTEYRIRTKRLESCECGTVPCHRRRTTPGHMRIERLQETRIPKEVIAEIPLESVTPGHPRWDRALAYSAQDAVLALAVYDLATLEMRSRKVDVPWLSLLVPESPSVGATIPSYMTHWSESEPMFLPANGG
jgi:hypothetical protein